eukprot:3724705-Lingulodinium_polyedra.AAC.1
MALPEDGSATPTAIRRTLLQLQWPEPLAEQALHLARLHPSPRQAQPDASTPLLAELIGSAWLV